MLAHRLRQHWANVSCFWAISLQKDIPLVTRWLIETDLAALVSSGPAGGGGDLDR